jgi:AraC-like DNA-binding protein
MREAKPKIVTGIDTIDQLCQIHGFTRPVNPEFDIHTLQQYQQNYFSQTKASYEEYHQLILITHGELELAVNDLQGYRILYMPLYFTRFLSFGNWSLSSDLFLNGPIYLTDIGDIMITDYGPIAVQIMRETLFSTINNEDQLEIISQLNLLMLLKVKKQLPKFNTNPDIQKADVTNSKRIVKEFIALVKSDFKNIERGNMAARIKTITEYAALLNIHPNYLNRVVNRTLGMSVSELLVDCVLRKAKTLLAQTDMTISQIAYQLGFQSDSYFCFYFKKHTGITPSYLRREMRRA